jgi:hypothetical protein
MAHAGQTEQDGLVTTTGWFAVRCFFLHGPLEDDVRTYEERVTLWRAASAEEAFDRAEAEAAEHAGMLTEVAALATMQCYELADDPGDGAEVFSLMRDSPLDPGRYITRHFSTGDERQTTVPDVPPSSHDAQDPFQDDSGS